MSRTEMRYTRNEMIEAIQAIFKPQNGSRWLEQLDVVNLEQLMDKSADEIDLFYRRCALSQQKAATNRQREMLAIFHYSGLKSPSPRNEAALDQVFPGPTLSLENFRSYVQQNPDVARQRFEWASEPFAQVEQAAAARLAGEKRLFAEFCRKNSVGENQANFGIWRETHSTAGLAPASQEELDQWNQERIEQRNNFLLGADNQTLRNIARREGAERHHAAVQEETDRQLQASQARDAAIGFPPLPAVWKGEPLDPGFIKGAASETLRLLNRRFGAAAVNARLCGK
ncbi:MAG: hypothetical protein JWO71_2484 [Candidatus Acidoferrum typicum]|nr:hypothetical protein [Candidatus Acidoferrum typicum]